MKIGFFKILLALVLVFPLSVHANELTERLSIRNQTQALFMQGDFKALEEMSRLNLETEPRTSSGVYHSMTFYRAIDDLAPSRIKEEEYWTKLNAQVDKWLQKYPDSPAANMTKALVLEGYAWRFRGSAYNGEVDDEALEIFKDKLQIADKFLSEIKPIADRDPYFYALSIRVKNVLGSDEAEIHAVTTEGLDKFPYYYDIYFARALSLTPAWGGSAEQIEAFALEAVERSKDREGMSMYTRIYWAIFRNLNQLEFFQNSPEIWDRMKLGMDDIEAKYPAQWNVQHFMKFACIASDKQRALDLLTKVEGELVLFAWENDLSNFEKCKAWANDSIAILTVSEMTLISFIICLILIVLTVYLIPRKRSNTAN